MLMIASAGLILVPRDTLVPLRNVLRLLALPQLIATQAAGGLAEPLRNLGTPAISGEQHAALLKEKEALENENISLRLKLAELEARIDELAMVRQRGFPTDAALVPAKVVALDALASRGSLLLDKGSSHNVRSGDWVTSRLFVDAGTSDGARPGAGVLARESLIGWVEESEYFTSRVVLLSDRSTNRPTSVHITRHDPARNTWQVVTVGSKPALFSLYGAGRGLMKIVEIDARAVDQGLIRAGDLVTSDPRDPRLPVAMVIGRISRLERVRTDKKKPLYYVAEVEHRYDPRLLSEVYIADLSRQIKQQGGGGKP
jgi:cell shape-determining protein MreC